MVDFNNRYKQSINNIEIESKFMFQPGPSTIIQYRINENPFDVSVKFKREATLNKNIFQLQQKQPKNYQKKDTKNQLSQLSMLDPFLMNCAAIKVLLIEKIIAYLSSFSIILSIYITYFETEEDLICDQVIMGSALTGVLLVLNFIGIYFHQKNFEARKQQQKFKISTYFLKFFALIVHPTVWTESMNNWLHLILLARVYFPISYYIRSSVYFNPRANRLANIYGIKPEFNFILACKAILNNMPLSSVLCIYIVIVFFYTHCLFLVNTENTFIDCFSIVIVTLPTIGYGEYHIYQNSQRVVVLLILITGVALNAFVTLSMLKQFEMTQRQNNSYTLRQKLQMVSEIQRLSTQYIIQKINKQKFKKIKDEEKLTDQEFKQKYKACKARYRLLSFQDSNCLFGYFRDTLLELKIKSQQTSNMISVLISHLICSSKRRKQKGESGNFKIDQLIIPPF